MGEMIERVAEAIRKSNAGYYQWARAAIEAMRELPEDPGPRYTAGEYSRRNQEAMIDDALSDTIRDTLESEDKQDQRITP